MSEQSEPQDVVLILDDDEIFRNRLCRAFEARHWITHGVGSAEPAILMANRLPLSLALIDLRLAEGSGLDAIEQIRKENDHIKIIMFTGYGSIATALSATKLGADDYISKPADVDQILTAYQNLQQETGPEPVTYGAVPSLARVEWEHIQRVLSDCQGNISQAARLLGLHRRSLQRKLEKYPPNR